MNKRMNNHNEEPARMQPAGVCYFGLVRNETTGRRGWSADIGLRDRQEADDRMPMCPDDAEPGHVVLRRMTRNAPDQLTHPVEGVDWDYEQERRVRCEIHHICMDLPVSDHYYVV